MTNKELSALGKMCGVYPIALHMRKNGYPLFMALYLLTKRGKK